MLSLMARAAIVPARPVRVAAEALRHLFTPALVAVVLAAWVAFDVWLVAVHGVGRGVEETVRQPAHMLAILGLMVTSAAFHELGHAAACRYGGAEPGAIGVGVYLVFPVFYTDVTDSYRLGRAGRVRTDLGGLYFNSWSSSPGRRLPGSTGAACSCSSVLLTQIQMLQQLARGPPGRLLRARRPDRRARPVLPHRPRPSRGCCPAVGPSPARAG